MEKALQKRSVLSCQCLSPQPTGRFFRKKRSDLTTMLEHGTVADLDRPARVRGSYQCSAMFDGSNTRSLPLPPYMTFLSDPLRFSTRARILQSSMLAPCSCVSATWSELMYPLRRHKYACVAQLQAQILSLFTIIFRKCCRPSRKAVGSVWLRRDLLRSLSLHQPLNTMEPQHPLVQGGQRWRRGAFCGAARPLGQASLATCLHRFKATLNLVEPSIMSVHPSVHRFHCVCDNTLNLSKQNGLKLSGQLRIVVLLMVRHRFTIALRVSLWKGTPFFQQGVGVPGTNSSRRRNCVSPSERFSFLLSQGRGNVSEESAASLARDSRNNHHQHP